MAEKGLYLFKVSYEDMGFSVHYMIADSLDKAVIKLLSNQGIFNDQINKIEVATPGNWIYGRKKDHTLIELSFRDLKMEVGGFS